MSLPARIQAKISVRGDCWLWQAGRDRDGYGKVWHRGATRRAVRVIYELLLGPAPAGLVPDHLCRVRSCVNPLHVEWVTNGTNVLRGNGPPAQNARKVLCIRGHPLGYVTPDGRRQCRTCNALRTRKFRRK